MAYGHNISAGYLSISNVVCTIPVVPVIITQIHCQNNFALHNNCECSRVSDTCWPWQMAISMGDFPT